MTIVAAHNSIGRVASGARTAECMGPCVTCGSTDHFIASQGIGDYEYGAPGTYAWLRCNGCGLVRLDPMPTNFVLSLAYPDHYHAYQPPRSRLVASYVGLRRRARAKELSRLVPGGGTILDIGCGTGALLSALGACGRFRLLGVEYREEAAEAARRCGGTIWTGELEDADIKPNSVDLAIMEHVIEHVRDPAETLERIARSLKPGGRIVGETPNLRCPDAKIFGRYWGGGHAPRHLYLFTPRSLERALCEQGFTDIRITHPVHPAHLALSIQNWLRRRRVGTGDLVSGRSWYFPMVCAAAMPPAMIMALMRCSGVIRFEARSPA